MCRQKGQKTNRVQKVATEDTLLLDEIFNTANPTIKQYFAEVYYEEIENAEKRAIYRVADKFKHMLPDSQQRLVTEAMHNMAMPVALVM